MKKLATILWVSLAILIGIKCIQYFSSKSSSSNKPNVVSVDNEKFLAYNYAIKFVKKQLKSPSSAIFPTGRERYDAVTYLYNGEYQINSWVESQNSFGAKIKTNFSCKIIIKDDNVRCENLYFDE